MKRLWNRFLNLFRKKSDIRGLQSYLVLEMGRANIAVIQAAQTPKEEKAQAIIKSTLETYEAVAKIWKP